MSEIKSFNAPSAPQPSGSAQVAKAGASAGAAPSHVSLSPSTPSGSGLPSPVTVTFDRHELREIFNLYGRMVASGEWRDYAMDFGKERAVFSVYRRSNEHPLFRIEKNPKLARKQGAYAVIAVTGLILKRGHELARVLKVLDKPVKLAVV